MRRFSSHLIRLGSILSLLLAAGLIFAWLMSYANVTFISSRGVFYLVRVPPDERSPNRLSVNVERWVDDDSMQLTVGQHLDKVMRMNYQPLKASAPTWKVAGVTFWNTMGFANATAPPGHTVRTTRVQVLAVSYGWPFAVAAVYPTLVLARLTARIALQRQRRRRGLCPTCGYDLRGHRGGDRCPECGAVVA